MERNEQNYLTNTLQEIIIIQKTVKEPDWIKKLFLIKPVKDTIPFILYLKSGHPYYAYGNIGKLKGKECFTTPFFRVEDMQGGYATLMLLKCINNPSVNNHGITDVSQIEKTSFCVDVDIHMFGGIQILSPELVV